MQQGFEKVIIPLQGGGVFILCSSVGHNVSLDETDTIEGMGLPQGWKGQVSAKALPPIVIKDTNELRLVETYHYEWAYEGETFSTVQSPLAYQRNWRERVRKGRPPEGSFQIVNFLGSSSITFISVTTDEDEKIPLEFISKKLDFDTEYRRMTEDIASFCEQLLLSANAPTSLRFSAAPTEQRKLTIESFFFLRHFLNHESLSIIMEHIQRNPHRTLESQQGLRPVSHLTSSDHLRSPNTMLRGWRVQGGRRVATEGVQVSKRETFDTPVNRFVLFALMQFRKLVEEVLSMKGQEVGESIKREADEMANLLDSTVSQPFFKGISRLQKLPLNNQTLQKREGYRDLLKAWILVESASSLTWDGREECYKGNTRNVATLYEYWLFLELHKILTQINGMERLDTVDEDSFIQEKGGCLSINLKSGKHSRTRFCYTDNEGTKLNLSLHYELTFNQSRTATSGKSYSRQFRPDYTLSIYPARYATEEDATHQGEVRHLHFDAKYRVNGLSQIMGDEGNLSEQKTAEKSLNTYQRGDLLKMHTYNDALRKTIGSYVLYPGNDSKGERMPKFNEIAPGVGAYAMKPGQKGCSDTLQAFIELILEHQASQFTQFSYLDEVRHATYSEQPSYLDNRAKLYNVARPSAKCVMLWMRSQDIETFKEFGFAYCRALTGEESDKAVDLDLSTEVGSEFIPIKGGRSTRELVGWRGKITGAHFISKEKLKAYFAAKTGGKLEPSSNTSHYILYEFSDISNIPRRDVSGLHRSKCNLNTFMAVTCTWNEVIKCELLPS